MDILKKFTIKNLKLNKKRTIVTIIGVMLSTALICAVAGMLTSTQKTLINHAKANNGNYHVCFNNVPKDELKYVKENNNVKSYFLSSSLGYAKFNDIKNDEKPYVYVMEYEKVGLEEGGLKLVNGRMPENSNEIVIPEHLLTNGRVNLKIGDTIKLDIGTRQLKDGTKLTQKDSYQNNSKKNSEENGEKNTGIKQENLEEEIVDIKTKQYKIVGIIERPNYGTIEGFSAPGYTLVSFMENQDNIKNANISVLYNTVKNNKDITNSIIKTIQNDTGIEIDKTVNKQLMDYEGGLGESTMNSLYSVASVVIVIIILSSVFVIRNSFSISVSEKTKQYGMMSSVGATRKQIKKSVLFEGLLIGIIAIPLGILCGMLAIEILLVIVNCLIGDMMGDVKFVYSVPIIPIIASIAISSITIYLSCIIPARRAAKISAIEAIRGNEDIKIKSKKIKTSKFIKKLFGIGGVIASKNLKRSRKKYRTTIISLIVSISIFVSLSSFLDYGEKITGRYYKDLNYNIEIYNGTEDLYKEIIKLDDIDEFCYSFSISADLDINKYGSEYGKKMVMEYTEGEDDYKNTINIVLLNNDYFKKFTKELGIKEENYKDIAILEDDWYEYNEDGSSKLQNWYNIKAGDTINIKLDGESEERQVKIAKKSDKRPMGYEKSYSNGGWLFVSQDFMKNKDLKNYIGALNINSPNPNNFENRLIDLKKENESYSDIKIINYSIMADQDKRLILLVSIFLYGFITVITLIGVTNIFNTITTNMILRSKEFANLKSIGMTTKEFNKMIRLESILYGLKSLIIGIPIGLIGSYFIYKAFAGGIDFGYIIPWKAILVSIIFVFIIVGVTMKYSLRKINKQNIIETIRSDNI